MNVSAAILAGGRAVRFGGQDKGALIVGGRTIRDRQLDALRPLTGDVLIVGGVPAQAPGARHVPDVVSESGPMGGLLTALLSAQHDATIALACDMPFVSTQLLACLVALAGDVDVVVPRTARGYHPLCAVYRRSCIDPLRRRLKERHLKMIELFDDVRIRVAAPEDLAVAGDPDRLLANINTPADHAGLEAVRSHET